MQHFPKELEEDSFYDLSPIYISGTNRIKRKYKIDNGILVCPHCFTYGDFSRYYLKLYV